MNKAELIDALAGRLGDRKSATAALDAVLAEIQNAVTKGDKVAITGFGVFEKRVRAARTARNPRTGESVKVKKTSVPAFRAGASFKDMVAAGPRSEGHRRRPRRRGRRRRRPRRRPKKAAPAKRRQRQTVAAPGSDEPGPRGRRERRRAPTYGQSSRPDDSLAGERDHPRFPLGSRTRTRPPRECRQHRRDEPASAAHQVHGRVAANALSRLAAAAGSAVSSKVCPPRWAARPWWTRA